MALDMKALMQQANKMQEKMEEAKQKVAQIVVIGESGGEAVKVHMDGSHKARKVEIDPTLVSENDIDMLCDLLVAAINHAVEQADETTRREIMSFAGDLKLDAPEDIASE